jgi:hypothetical protein
MPDGLRLAQGSPIHINEIAECLQRNGARHQLAPCWTSETLFHPDHTPDLAPEDFFVALDRDRVVGCLAAWDQNRFKQSVVRGYSGTLSRWRGLANVGARLAGWPVLPPPHTPFRHSYASHLAVDDDNPQVFAALLRALHNHLAAQGHSHFMIGLSKANPLLPIVTASYRHITYASQLYLVGWEDSLEAISRVNNQVPGPEIAVL